MIHNHISHGASQMCRPILSEKRLTVAKSTAEVIFMAFMCSRYYIFIQISNVIRML